PTAGGTIYRGIMRSVYLAALLLAGTIPVFGQVRSLGELLPEGPVAAPSAQSPGVSAPAPSPSALSALPGLPAAPLSNPESLSRAPAEKAAPSVRSVLVTGFHPFGEVARNISGEAAERMDGLNFDWDGTRYRLVGRSLPVSFERSSL